MNQLPIKQAQLSVNKFNEVVQHLIDLLKYHKSNIEKCMALRDWSKVQKEEINAIRVMKQLKNLICELEDVRSKVKNEDRRKFDQMIEIEKQQAIDAMKEFSELRLKTLANRYDDNEINYTKENDKKLLGSLPPIHVDLQNQEDKLRITESCLNEFENLQQDVQDLNSMFNGFSSLVNEQSEAVEIISNNVEEADKNVLQGEINLSTAFKYKKSMYPVVGAVLGTCIGGPLGLVAGFKAGGLAAVGFGILGFTGGKALKSADIVNGTENLAPKTV